METLRTWHDYFLLLGEASATLLGLVFVSLALVTSLAELPGHRQLFASPTMMHFVYAAALSVVCVCPWQNVAVLGLLITLIGLAALAHCLTLIPAMRDFHATTQRATPSTWLSLVFGPLAAGAISAASGIFLLKDHLKAMAGIAAAAALFAGMGLRNVWRLLIWMLEQHHRQRK